jgi:hypothetical protein
MLYLQCISAYLFGLPFLALAPFVPSDPIFEDGQWHGCAFDPADSL